MGNITRFAFILAIAATVLGLSGCDQLLQILSDSEMSDSDVPQFTELEGDITVGVVLPLTGRFTELSGEPVGNGLELAIEEINNGQRGDGRIRFIVEDDMSTVGGAVAAFEKLIDEDGVSLILGPVSSSMTAEAFPVAQESGVVAMSPTSSARGLSALGDFVFRASLTTDVLIPNGVAVTHAKLGYQRVATLYDAVDVFSTDSENAFRESLAARGVEVAAAETFESGDTDFTGQLTRIMELNPDAVFVSSQPQEKANILTQAREVGIPVSVPLILRTLTSTELAAVGMAAEGAMTFTEWTSTLDNPKNLAFVQNYTAAYGSEPTNFAARAYTAAYVLAEGIANAGSTEPMAVRDALADIKDFDTIFGSFSFNDVGDAVYEPMVLIVENGTLKRFE